MGAAPHDIWPLSGEYYSRDAGVRAIETTLDMSGSSPEAGAFAAQNRIGIGFAFTFVPLAKTAVAHYRACARAAGWEPAAEQVIYRAMFHVADSDEEAFADISRLPPRISLVDQNKAIAAGVQQSGYYGVDAAALWLALDLGEAVGAVVLAVPDGPADDAFRDITQPVLVLCGTRDGLGGGDRYRALLRDGHFMLVYDAGSAIGGERPEALTFIAREFFERRDLFLVSRESGITLP